MQKSIKEIVKFYDEYSLCIGTIVGGPLAAIYMIYKNYINLDNKEYAKKSIGIGVGITLLGTIIISNIPNYSSAILMPALIAYIFFAKLQKKKIETIIKKNEGGRYYLWKGLWIGFISLIITLSIAIIAAIIVVIIQDNIK